MPIDASHFTMVGFQLDLRDEAAVSRSLDGYLSTCTLSLLKAPDSVCLVRDASGAELRIGLRKKRFGGDQEMITLNPAFSGESQVEVEIVGDASDPEWKPFEVTLTAHFKGEQTPIVFDLADPAEALRLKPGTKVPVRLSAFVFEPEVYADEAAYYAAQKKDNEGKPDAITFAGDYFIPSGMFTPDDKSGDLKAAKRPTAHALFAGTVLKASKRRNQAGGDEFVWALVRTYGGATMDVLIDPRSIEAVPAPGAILSGSFWISGRIATP